MSPAKYPKSVAILVQPGRAERRPSLPERRSSEKKLRKADELLGYLNRDDRGPARAY